MGAKHAIRMPIRALYVAIIVALILVTQASAGRGEPTIGERIEIYPDGGVQEFPAGQPFHIKHGWIVGPPEYSALGLFDFLLEIDGEPVPLGLRYISPSDDRLLRIYNFPEGIPAGTYIFVGYWYLPCQYSDTVTDCPDPNEQILELTRTVIITFTP